MDDGGWIAAIGILTCVFSWSLLRWDALRSALRWLRAGARSAAGALRAVEGAAMRLARPSETGRVGLGEVSEMVDVVRLGLTAGLSFDAALGLYCEQANGTLADRMDEARLSWQLGLVTREEGLLGVARAVGIRQLESFAVAVSQAHALGAPLSDTLERQGKEMRAAHRAEVERRIERAPVKMLIPTGTLILPALLLSIVGPLLAAGGMV